MLLWVRPATRPCGPWWPCYKAPPCSNKLPRRFRGRNLSSRTSRHRRKSGCYWCLKSRNYTIQFQLSWIIPQSNSIIKVYPYLWRLICSSVLPHCTGLGPWPCPCPGSTCGARLPSRPCPRTRPLECRLNVSPWKWKLSKGIGHLPDYLLPTVRTRKIPPTTQKVFMAHRGSHVLSR